MWSCTHQYRVIHLETECYRSQDNEHHGFLGRRKYCTIASGNRKRWFVECDQSRFRGDLKDDDNENWAYRKRDDDFRSGIHSSGLDR